MIWESRTSQTPPEGFPDVVIFNHGNNWNDAVAWLRQMLPHLAGRGYKVNPIGQNVGFNANKQLVVTENNNAFIIAQQSRVVVSAEGVRAGTTAPQKTGASGPGQHVGLGFDVLDDGAIGGNDDMYAGNDVAILGDEYAR